jgi:dinuclear metal center YbgI/SA1388 family protein
MDTVQDVLDAIERIAPSRHALPEDRVGLQLGERSCKVERGLVSLDWSKGLIERAIEVGASVIVCHHPLVWEPLRSITADSRSGETALRLAESGIAFISCHTNWDCALGGVSEVMAGRLGLQEIAPFGEAAAVPYSKIVTFCPPEALDGIIDALSSGGAGVIGLYERCAFFSEGKGTYIGGIGSKPAIGAPGRVETAHELRLEMRVPTDRVAEAESALRAAHPYEEPAFDFLDLLPVAEMPLGRIGRADAHGEVPTLEVLVHRVKQRFETRCWAWGNAGKRCRKVATVGGAGDSFWRAALDSGADVLVTGEVRHHVAVEAAEAGLAMIAAGHYATEQPGCAALRDRLAEALEGIRWELYVPSPGEGGRPLSP